jgi:hypothetical protein
MKQNKYELIKEYKIMTFVYEFGCCINDKDYFLSFADNKINDYVKNLFIRNIQFVYSVTKIDTNKKIRISLFVDPSLLDGKLISPNTIIGNNNSTQTPMELTSIDYYIINTLFEYTQNNCNIMEVI